MLNGAGIKAAVLTTQTAPEDREAWYERQLKAGIQVFIGHPRLVQTGLDYVEYGSGPVLFLLKPVCFHSETPFSEDGIFGRLLVLDYCPFSDHPPAIPGSSRAENQRDDLLEVSPWIGEGRIRNLPSERDAESALTVVDHPCVCLACIRK